MKLLVLLSRPLSVYEDGVGCEVWERTGTRGKLLWLLLLPVSLFYAVAVQLRNSLYTLGWVKSARLPRPVISIGNLTVGGTGKTPTCLWLAEELKSQGLSVGILSRGYRREETRPARFTTAKRACF